MKNKLYVYDQSSKIDRGQADGRFAGDSSVLTLPVSSVKSLLAGLDSLKGKVKFDRAVFQTHGSPGAVYFNNEALTASRLHFEFLNRGYESLFPTPARLYFDGCNIGNGSLGIDFLTEAGSVFLRQAGGEAFAWSNVGSGLPGWIPWVGGHTVHLGGSVTRLRFSEGGVPIPEPKVEFPESERLNVGNKI